jgi:hypothetical protein
VGFPGGARDFTACGTGDSLCLEQGVGEVGDDVVSGSEGSSLVFGDVVQTLSVEPRGGVRRASEVESDAGVALRHAAFLPSSG